MSREVHASIATQNGLTDLDGLCHCHVELAQGLVIFVLSVDNKDEGTTTTEDRLRIEGRIEEVELTREVPNLKLNEGAVGNVCTRGTKSGKQCRG